VDCLSNSSERDQLDFTVKALNIVKKGEDLKELLGIGKDTSLLGGMTPKVEKKSTSAKCNKRGGLPKKKKFDCLGSGY